MMLALEFVADLSDALFLPVVVLLIAAAWRRTAWRSGPVLRLVLTAAGVMLALRIAFTVGHVPVSTRYFLGLTVLALPFAAAGIDSLTAWLILGLRRIGRDGLAETTVRWLLVSLVLVVFLGKGLKPDKRAKAWLREIPRLMAVEAGSERPILISELDDFRLGYYSGGVQVKICRDGEVIRRRAADGSWPKVRCYGGELAERGRLKHAGDWQELPGAQGWEPLVLRLQELSGPVFLIINREDGEFRDEFARRGLPFPFRRIREFRERKDRPPLILYGMNRNSS
jgi:hypothetical protein